MILGQSSSTLPLPKFFDSHEVNNDTAGIQARSAIDDPAVRFRLDLSTSDPLLSNLPVGRDGKNRVTTGNETMETFYTINKTGGMLDMDGNYVFIVPTPAGTGNPIASRSPGTARAQPIFGGELQ
ncbi:MAG: hypothetical protein M1837_006530 [Sclerophora amabilis]|nr:MAG: hypothetical protein M1837_006530 [Sclerophora amabilis]